MGQLSSGLFTNIDHSTPANESRDQQAVQRLEDCAVGVNEALTHIAPGQSGEHVERVQIALASIRDAEPGLGIPPFSITAVYDPAFAKAVFEYKKKRDIRNFRNEIDNIVGVKTIKTLDRESKSKPKQQPKTPERPANPKVIIRPDNASCLPDSTCPLSDQFSVELVAGISGGDGVELARYFFDIRDTKNGLTATYKLTGGGVGLGSPISAAGGGSSTAFRTKKAVRVTRFGPIASIESGVAPDFRTSVGILNLSFRPDGSTIPSLKPFILVDTGPVGLPGGSVHGGKLTLFSKCQGEPGASRP